MVRRFKGGGIPFYWDVRENAVKVCLVTSTNPMFGGPKPQIAKGEADKGEKPFETARREMFEETGIDPTHIVATVDLGKIKKKTYDLYVYGYELLNEVPCIPNWEAIGHWYTIDNALQLIREDQLEKLQLLRDML